MASTTTSEPPEPPPEETRNWLELPEDVMAAILNKVGAIDILANAQMVCTTWRRICKDAAMWRVIRMENCAKFEDMGYDTEKMAKHAVDLSCGQLVDISIEYSYTDELLQYIVDRSSQLQRLRLVWCEYCYLSSSILKELPLLEELHLYYTEIAKDAIETAGRFCPNLKSFKLATQWFNKPRFECDVVALTIAKNMPQLRHLQLFADRMTNTGLQAILNGCPSLELLDLRQCFNVNLNGDLVKICTDQIKDFRGPYDSTEDYEFDAEIRDCESMEGDLSGLEDIWSDGFYYDDEYYESDDYDDFTLPFDEYAELLDYYGGVDVSL